MKRYSKYIKPYWIFFVLAPCLMLVEVYCDVQIPKLAADIIDLGIVPSDASMISQIGLIMVLYIGVSVIGGVGASFCASRAAVSFSSDLRSDLFKKIQSFSFANVDKFSTGSLITRLTNDVTQLQMLVTMSLRMVFRAPGMLIGSLFMAFTINSKVAIIFVIIIPILASIIGIVLYFSYHKFGLLQDKVDNLNANVREGLLNIRVIKALTREKYEAEKFTQINHDLRVTGLSAYRLSILQMPLMTLVINMATVAVLWFSAKLLNLGEIQIGNVSSLITYLTQILMSVNMLAMIFLQSSRALASSKRVSAILDEEIDIVDIESDHTVESGRIQFENVSFRYYKNSEETVLSKINFTIQSGQMVGIIGSTGCGKTSLVHLIPRLYDADEGVVYVDGRNVKSYSLKNLRDQVSVVLQNNMLFTGTIKDNLLWGDESATMAEIQEVCQWAQASEFIDAKALQYESVVEQGGVNLSGGQKQRLCIARALLKKPKILILDDSTSAVDTATERVIRNHFENDLKDTTKIIIAQRISSIIHADSIIVMNDGKIEAIGTHDECLINSSTYKEIYQSQMNTEVMNHGE